nr:LLM class flavin-dependent oxidoreductase [Nocardia colli]
MKFAISYSTPFYGADPDRIIAFAQHAEACGFEGLYLPDHIALYPGAKVGNFEMPATLPYPDPLDCLSFVAAATQRLLLGTGVLLLPYRHPVLLAKRLATIDVLSRGRMRLLTVGLGTLPGEATATGVDFATRGRRTDEAIDVLRLLWSGDAEGSASTASSSPSTRWSASRNPLACRSCRSTSAAPAEPPPAEPADVATATSPAGCSALPNAPLNSTSPVRKPLPQAVIRTRSNTPAGDRSTCPPSASPDWPPKG